MLREDYEMVIGLEVHAELSTKTKILENDEKIEEFVEETLVTEVAAQEEAETITEEKNDTVETVETPADTQVVENPVAVNSETTYVLKQKIETKDIKGAGNYTLRAIISYDDADGKKKNIKKEATLNIQGEM